MPLGMLISAAFLFAILSTGIGLLWWGWRRRSVGAKWAGGALIFTVVCLVVWCEIEQAATELNPIIRADAEILGTYADSTESFALLANHTFIHQTRYGRCPGTWSRTDFNVSFHEAGAATSIEMRFIQYFGKFRLLPRLPDDPDEWSASDGLPRQ